uniref:Uncharacterized protein n=1 Tax=Rhizophora mucronata TaxID=61149 RepID=A0A2P2JVP1_RHIMU
MSWIVVPKLGDDIELRWLSIFFRDSNSRYLLRGDYSITKLKLIVMVVKHMALHKIYRLDDAKVVFSGSYSVCCSRGCSRKT